MNTGLVILIAVGASVVVIPLVVHIYVRRYLVASALSAMFTTIVCIAMLRSVSKGSPSIELFAVMFAATYAASFLFALGVGIPFNRKRNPIRDEGAGDTPLQRYFTRRMSLLEIGLGLAFAILFSRMFKGMASP